LSNTASPGATSAALSNVEAVVPPAVEMPRPVVAPASPVHGADVVEPLVLTDTPDGPEADGSDKAESVGPVVLPESSGPPESSAVLAPDPPDPPQPAAPGENSDTSDVPEASDPHANPRAAAPKRAKARPATTRRSPR
jgi:hypothetical protein